MTFYSQMLTGLADAAGAAGAATDATVAAGGTGELLGMIIPMVLMFVVFYFLLIRPQRKKDKKVKEMLNNLKAGDRICTIGGIYGTIQGFRDDNVVLSVGEKDMPMVIARWAVRNVEAVTIENDGEVLA